MTARAILRFRPFLWLSGLALLVALRQWLMRDLRVINVVNGVPNPDDLAAASADSSTSLGFVGALALFIVFIWLDRRLTRSATQITE